MVRTSVSLSLDEETLAIWKQIPQKQRSAKKGEYLRACSREGTLQTPPSTLSPETVPENGCLTVAELLLNLDEPPEETKKKPVSQERRSMYEYLLDLDKWSILTFAVLRLLLNPLSTGAERKGNNALTQWPNISLS